MADTEKTLRGADGLRTLACLMVVFHHLSQQMVFNPTIQAPAALRSLAEFFTSAGSSGVSVFFVLSGFLLAVPFWKAFLDGRSLPDLRVYAARRAGRIMPGFYLNLLFFFVLGILFHPEAPALIWRYFAGLTFTSGFHWLTFFPVEDNGPLWSIGFEVVSYVLLPLGMAGLFLFLNKVRNIAAGLAWWAAVWLAVFAVNALLQSSTPEELGKGWQYGLAGGAKFWMPRYNPLGFFGHFALGTFAAGLAVWWSRSGHTKGRWFDAASLVLTAAWGFVLASRSNQDQFSWTLQGQPYYFPLFAGLTAALLACLTQSPVLGRVFDNRFSRYTAKVSFGLYLWHTLVIGRFNGAIGDTGEWLMLVAVTLAGSYLIASLSWKYWEEPILRRVQAWKPGASRLRPSRFTLFVGTSAAVLVLLPLLLTAVFRPTAWTLPTTAGQTFAFNQPGAVTGLTEDGEGGWYAAFNGSEIYRIRADKTYEKIYTLPQPPADLRLSYERPRDNPVATPEPGLIVLKAENPYLWNLRRGPNGNLFAAAGDRVIELSPQGEERRTERFERGSLLGVVDLAFDAEGNLYVPDGGLVFRLSPSGERTVFLEDGSFSGASGIAFTGTRLLLSDFDPLKPEEGRLLSFSLKDGQAAGPPVAIPAPGALFPAVLGSDVYFSKAFTGWLYRWNGTGEPQALWASNLRSVGALAAQTGSSSLFAAGWDGTLGEIAVGGQP